MDSTAVCNMTQDYTPHFGANTTPYSTPQGPPPLTPTDIFERPRNKRKSSYPSGLVNYNDNNDMNNGNKEYYMDIDDNSIDANTDTDSPPNLVSSANETPSHNRSTYLSAPQDFTATKLSPSQERGSANGFHGLEEKFGGPSDPKYMRNGNPDNNTNGNGNSAKFPMLSPTEPKFPNQDSFSMNGHEKYMQSNRGENLEKFSESDRYQMFNELTKAHFEHGFKLQEKYAAEKYNEMQFDGRYGEFSPDQQVPARSPGSAERQIKQEPSTPPPPLTSPAGLKIPYPPILADLSPTSFGNLSPNKFPEPLNGFAHDQPLDFSTKLKDEFYTTTQAPAPASSPEDRSRMDNKMELNHDGTSNFTCKHCHRPFKSQVNLDRHVEKSHNPKSSKIFSCLLCPYTTRFYSNMYVHIRTHTGDKPYWCGACGASFSQGSSLKIHIISKHGGNKKFFILDRKLGKANLLRFWQRREASQLNTDNENNFKPDLKKFNGFPNAFPHMMSMNGMGGEGPPPMPGLEKMAETNTQTPNNVQNPLMSNHIPMNNIGNLFPNGMNMFGPMNPLGLNLMGQNPLAGANPMLFGNNNLLLQQSLMSGLNLKNSAFFTKTTKFSDEREGKDKSPSSSQGAPHFYNEMKESQMKQNGGQGVGNPLAGLLQNGKMSPTKMRFPDFPPVSLPGGLPPFGPLPPLGGSLPSSLATTLSTSSLTGSMMPMPPLMTSPNHGQQDSQQKQHQQISPRSAPQSPIDQTPENGGGSSENKNMSLPHVPNPKSPENQPQQQQQQQQPQPQQQQQQQQQQMTPNAVMNNTNAPNTPTNNSNNTNTSNASPNQVSNNVTTPNDGNMTATTDIMTNNTTQNKPGSEVYERKLRDLRRNVVKMLRMMVPDLQMDKNMNQEGEDVDILLKEVIWSTATDMDGIPDERML